MNFSNLIPSIFKKKSIKGSLLGKKLFLNNISSTKRK